MLIYKKGDILKSDCNFICHQVNVQGVMGGGLALQVATQYPNVLEEYQNLCKKYYYDYNLLKSLGKNVKINDKQYISNCFTQKPNFDTDYEELKKCFTFLKGLAKANDYTICIPFKYGSGIANGDWNKIVEILEEIFIDYDLYIYELE